MFRPIKILDIDLAQPLVDLVGLEAYGSVRALIRLHGTPLGNITLPLFGGRLPAVELHRAIFNELSWPILRQHLSGLLTNQPGTAWTVADLAHSELAPAYAGPWPALSVAVCTRNRPDDILLCVEALTRLDYPGELEIIVVDNAPPDDATERAIRERFTAPHIRYVCEPRPGLDWARNRAITTARGEILAYTDDDVIVDPGWARAIGQVFAENPGVMALTGLVEPYELETEPQYLFERYGGFGRGCFQRWFAANLAGGERAATNYAGAGHFGTGANMAYRRAIFAEIGHFDPALDVGTVTNGGGDLEMFFRVLKAGHPLVYEPRALVRHRHRRDERRFNDQIANNGIGLYAYLVRTALHFPEERPALLRLSLWWFWYWYLRAFLLSFVRPAQITRSRRLIWAEARGALIGFRRYQQARLRAQPFDPDVDRLRVLGQTSPGLRPHATAVRMLDLAQPLSALEDVTAYPEVQLIVQRSGVLLGSLTLPNRYQALSVERLREAIVDHLHTHLLTSEVEQNLNQLFSAAQTILAKRYAPARVVTTASTVPTLTVSVVVATLDRPDDLRACLESLTNHQSQHVVEIVVVDNNPSSGQTAPVVAAFPGVRLVNETRRGLSYARNCGINASHGAIIVMTDDDVIVAPGWLDYLIAPFMRPDVMIVTGNVLPLQLETRAQRLFEHYGGLGRGFERREVSTTWFNSFRRTAVPTWTLGATANAAFRATIFHHPQIGLLDESLGAGTPTGCSEDTYLFYKVLKVGYTLVYEPHAYVWHRHRRDMHTLRKQIYSYSKGHVAYHLTTLYNDRDLRVIPYLGAYLPYVHSRALLRQALHMLRGRVEYSIDLTMLEIAGNLVGAVALRRSRQRVQQIGRSAAYVPPEQRPAPSTALATLVDATAVLPLDSSVS